MRWHREALTEELASEPDVAPSSRQRHYRGKFGTSKGCSKYHGDLEARMFGDHKVNQKARTD